MNYFSYYKGGKALYCLIFTAVLFPFSSSFGRELFRYKNIFFQQNQVQGTVTDGSTPLPGVNVSIKGKTNNSSTTDYSGQYTINARVSDTLIVSFIGFKTKFIPVNNSTKIDIKLEYDTTTLQEVRVNAGYYSVKESDRTGSIARITSKDIEMQPVTNVLGVMQGRMAGVSIRQDSGTPGGGFQINIRGLNSLRSDGNAPLYIIDGMPFSSQTIGSSQTSGFSGSMTSPLNGLDPSDITSIEVLKDADATAIYGSRGANGVVLITTKRGKSGGTSFEFETSSSFGRVAVMPELMKTEQYLAMRRRAYLNDGILVYPAAAYDINGTWDQNRYTDWQKVLIGGTSEIRNFKGQVSGGGQTTQFLLGSNYRSETTVLPGDFRYDKANVNLNLNHGADTSKFQIVFSMAYNFQRNKLPAVELTQLSRTLAPNAPLLYDSQGGLNWENGTWDNPLAPLKQEFKGFVNTLTAGSVLSYKITSSLLLKTNLGYTNITNKESKTQPYTMYNPSYGLGSSSSSLYLNNTLGSSWIIEPQLNWKQNFWNGTLDMLVGATFQRQKSERLVQFGSGFPSNGLINNLASASTHYIYASDINIYKYQAFFARINYNWRERFIINLTGRRDGSSRFGPADQFADFGAVGAAWLLHKEKFIIENSLLSFGKLRASYGTTGSDQIGDYQYFNTYAPTGVSYDGKIGLQPTRLFNPNFSWEVSKKLEIATEIGLFYDRIFFTSAWYQNRSSNQLIGIPLPSTTGFSSITANLDATVENTGWEFTLRTVNIDRQFFKWSTSMNLSLNRNKLLAFPGLESSTYATTYKIGRSLDIRHLYEWQGVDPQTGIYNFKDFNSDGKISSPEDRKYIADLTPKYFGGFENQLGYKGFNLDFLFHFVKQNNISYPAGVPGGSVNQMADLIKVWEKAGDINDYQKFTSGANSSALTAYSRYTSSSGVIKDASFIRLKSISLSYDLPSDFGLNAKIRLYLQGQNLFTITSFKDGDPELRFGTFLPPLKLYTFGIQVKF